MFFSSSSSNVFSDNDGVFIMLHELMHMPKGNAEFCKLRKLLSSILSSDIKKLAVYCHLCNYVEFDGDNIQLTESGLEYYLDRKRASSYVYC